MIRKIKCTKKELLQFFKKRGMVENWEISQKYKLTPGYTDVKLYRLQKQGVIKSFGKGHWVLTVYGIDRLKYYARKDNITNKDNDPKLQ